MPSRLNVPFQPEERSGGRYGRVVFCFNAETQRSQSLQIGFKGSSACFPGILLALWASSQLLLHIFWASQIWQLNDHAIRVGAVRMGLSFWLLSPDFCLLTSVSWLLSPDFLILPFIRLISPYIFKCGRQTVNIFFKTPFRYYVKRVLSHVFS